MEQQKANKKVDVNGVRQLLKILANLFEKDTALNDTLFRKKLKSLRIFQIIDSEERRKGSSAYLPNLIKTQKCSKEM